MPKRTLDEAELADPAAVAANKKARKEAKALRRQAERVANGKELVRKDATPKKNNNKKNSAAAKGTETANGEEVKKKKKKKERTPEEKALRLRSKAIIQEKKDRVQKVDEDAATGKMKESLEPSASEETAEEKAETVGALQEIVDENAEVVKDEASSTYAENAALTALPRAELDRFLADKFITITDPNKSNLRPITKFEYLPITDDKQLKPFANFKAPTPIQAAAWPFLLAGRDVIGVAETGSGKTMGFAVPCVRAISALPKKMRNMGPRAVIVSPTRELAVQSYDEIKKLTAVCGLEAVCVYGGVPKQEQRKLLKTADIVVATPGRLNDLIIEGFADLSKAAYVVLDEADRMLDKGFEEEIRKIINTTPAIGKRQTLMFTATWPESVRALAATFMQKPVKIAIGDNPSGDLRANTRIMQKVEVVDPRHKEWRLLQLLKEYSAGTKSEDRILVFCLYKKEATRVEIYIKGRGFRVAGIHGDLTQEQRSRALDGFKKGTTPILVATDVAARGLDIPDVQVVINCTFPLTVEDYVHRIGRTGRAGKQGLAITLFTEHDKAQSGALINVLKAANQEVPEELMKFGTTVKKKAHDAYGAFYKDTGDMAKTATKITFD